MSDLGTTAPAVHMSIVSAAIRRMSVSLSSYRRPTAPIAEAISRAMVLYARVRKVGRSTNMFVPTDDSDQVIGEIIVCGAYTDSA